MYDIVKNTNNISLKELCQLSVVLTKFINNIKWYVTDFVIDFKFIVV